MADKAAFPEGINAPVQYGEAIKAAAVYLKNFKRSPKDAHKPRLLSQSIKGVAGLPGFFFRIYLHPWTDSC
jgi:hypothetical protein